MPLDNYFPVESCWEVDLGWCNCSEGDRIINGDYSSRLEAEEEKVAVEI